MIWFARVILVAAGGLVAAAYAATWVETAVAMAALGVLFLATQLALGAILCRKEAER